MASLTQIQTPNLSGGFLGPSYPNWQPPLAVSGLRRTYGNMVIRGSYMALDFSTPGAIFLFFLLVGPLNGLMRIVRRAWSLTRSELLVVYAMMITASAIPTMGLSEYLLTITTAAQYFATPENEWASLIGAHVPPWVVPQSATAIQWFYEGKPKGVSLPWQPWVEPLCYWVLFAMSLYLVMISLMVVLRRQWIERERLLFPIVQVPLQMVHQDEEGRSTFWRNPVMWVGFALPAIVSSLNGLHAYYNTVPGVQLVSEVPILRETTSILFRLSFPMVGFSYLINLDIALSLWLFNLLAKITHGSMGILGVASSEKLGIYGAASKPILAHYGQGAFLVLVAFGLWLARDHLHDVWRKAVHGDERVDDSGEIMSYRAALICSGRLRQHGRVADSSRYTSVGCADSTGTGAGRLCWPDSRSRRERRSRRYESADRRVHAGLCGGLFGTGPSRHGRSGLHPRMER